MGAAENRTKNAAMAAHLVKSGYPHGRRKTGPMPNSGGLTMVKEPGSAAYQRLMAKRTSASAGRNGQR